MTNDSFHSIATEVNMKKEKKIEKMSFLAKFAELQSKMIIHNNALTELHPYQSKPLSWPLLIRGINYWTHLKDGFQIYVTGNVAGWWGGLVCIILFCGVTVLDMGLRKRGIPFIRSSKY